MKRILLSVLLLVASIPLYAQISDQQVTDMLQKMQQDGLNQQQVVMKLSQSGVTREQLMRVRAQIEETTAASTMHTERDSARMLRQLSEDLVQPQNLNRQQPVRPESNIFGHEIFNNDRLSFEPSLNIATPENYILGPGDVVIIDVWGDSQQTINQAISSDGSIVVKSLGPVYLNGLTLAEANERLHKSFARIYSGVADGGTFVKLSLERIRSIRINVMGEVVAPGTYTVPSLATLFHVLHNAGGPNDIGSLREVRINRGGKQVASVDIYSYLMEGRNDQDISLKDGDAVIVPPYANLVSITGKVKRPMIYEMKDGETLSSLLQYSGDFTGDAYTNAIRVIRKSGRELQVYNVETGDYGMFALTDGDSVSVDAVLERFENKVEVQGAVFRPGLYAFGEGVSTVKQLIEKAEGLQGDAFTDRAVLYRTKPDYTIEAQAVDLGALMSGSMPDIALQRDDVLEISSIFDLREEYTVTIMGDVGNPGIYPFAENMTPEDVVIRAGGLLESASTVRLDVARRIKNPQSTTENIAKAENFIFPLKNGLMASPESNNFVLQPFDVIYVRSSPGYSTQQNVNIKGEVLFGGQYVLSAKNERLSDLVMKAGGLTKSAYIEGARLLREMTEEEMARVESTVDLTRRNGTDSLSLEDLDIEQYYSVGINLDKALSSPGSDYDIVLREGDRLEVPEYMGTVRISGAVVYPNTVAYRKNATLKHYIEQGGGFASRAYKRRVYVVHMNGTVERAKMFSRSQATPGCEVIVPMRSMRNNMSVAEIMGMATSTASLAALVTSILNMTK